MTGKTYLRKIETDTERKLGEKIGRMNERVRERRKKTEWESETMKEWGNERERERGRDWDWDWGWAQQKFEKLRVGRKEQSVEMKHFSTSSREPTDNKEQREESNMREIERERERERKKKRERERERETETETETERERERDTHRQRPKER